MPLPDPGLQFDLNIGGTLVNQQAAPLLNEQTGSNLNHSGIGANLAKLGHKPPDWRMTDPYREEWSQTETSITATWIGTWSTLAAFREWVLGYSTSIIMPAFNAGAPPPALPPGFDGAHIINNPAAVGSPALLRVPPCQHPKYPWLYAVACQLVSGEGAYISDPACFAVDGQAHIVFGLLPSDPPGTPAHPITQEMIFYANNLGRGDGPGSPVNNFADGAARCQVTYQALDFEVRDDNDPVVGQFGELARWVSRYWEPAIQALPIAGQLAQQVVFNDPSNPVVNGVPLNGNPPVVGGFANGLPIPEAGVLLMPTRSCRWLWRMVPDVPWSAIAALEGKTNAADFDSVPGHPTYPKGTLLFQAPTIKRTPRTPAGRVAFDIEFRMDFRPQGWNYFPYLNFQFYRATFKDGSLIYKEADFTQAFKPPAPAQYQ